MNSVLLSTGRFVPTHRESNEQLERELQIEPGWIQQRTGVEYRAIADADDAVSDLAVRAGSAAIEKKPVGTPEISVLILATSTPDHLLPPTSAQVATQLGLEKVAAFDLAVACSGFCYALILADSIVRTQNATVLIIAANILSRRCSPTDIKTRPIFSDAAGAVILGPGGDQAGVLQSVWESDGSKSGSLSIPHGGSRTPVGESTFEDELHLMRLENGNAVFRYAVEKMAELGQQVVAKSGLDIEQIDWWIPHQANTRIIEATRRILKFPESRTLLTLPMFGNSSAATIPVTLDYFVESGRISKGDKVLFTAAAAGMTCSANLVTIH